MIHSGSSNFNEHFMPPIRPSQLPIWKGDRYEMKKHQTTLKLEGDHDFTNNRKFYSLPFMGSRSSPVKPQDNLHLQGELTFDSLESSPKRSRLPIPFIGDRAPIKRHQDNLRLDGIFYGFPTTKDLRPKTPLPELGLSPRHIQRSVMDRRSFRAPRSTLSTVLFDDRHLNCSAGDLFYGESRDADSFSRVGQPDLPITRASKVNDPEVFKLNSKCSSIESFSDSISNNVADEGAATHFGMSTSICTYHTSLLPKSSHAGHLHCLPSLLFLCHKLMLFCFFLLSRLVCN